MSQSGVLEETKVLTVAEAVPKLGLAGADDMNLTTNSVFIGTNRSMNSPGAKATSVQIVSPLRLRQAVEESANRSNTPTAPRWRQQDARPSGRAATSAQLRSRSPVAFTPPVAVGNTTFAFASRSKSPGPSAPPT